MLIITSSVIFFTLLFILYRNLCEYTLVSDNDTKDNLLNKQADAKYI